MVALSRISRALAFASASLLAVGATAQDAEIAEEPMISPAPAGNWASMIAQTEGGHMIGNPDAEGKLVEFMSYTCSHCADFARTGEGAVKLLYVPTGKVSFEIRHLIRDPIDLTVALAAQCGDPAQFPANHEALILRHDEWMTKAREATQAQTARWRFGSFGSRAQAIASDLDLYEIMERRGFSRSELDQCLTNTEKAAMIANQSQADVERFSLRGTPTFLLNGEMLEAHDWSSIQPHLDQYFRQD